MILFEQICFVYGISCILFAFKVTSTLFSKPFQTSETHMSMYGKGALLYMVTLSRDFKPFETSAQHMSMCGKGALSYKVMSVYLNKRSVYVYVRKGGLCYIR